VAIRIAVIDDVCIVVRPAPGALEREELARCPLAVVRVAGGTDIACRRPTRPQSPWFAMRPQSIGVGRTTETPP
jgi:hypothetical protein